MKIGGAKKIHYDSGPNMTPLVDVVMVILIFLMLAGSFASSTRFLLSKQGIHQKGQSPVKPSKDQVIDTPVEIHLSPSGDPSGFVARGTGIANTSDADQLKGQLITLREKFNNSGTPTEKLEVVLYPAPKVKYQAVLAAYQAALQADFTKVAFGATGSK
ncbi:MAG TPA: biopolymer transporter ExbD [Tepidisphaeraceae bacterium]|nr:biopolymer transporter ExbD [Tepidisphaeraceae bacterium]